MPGLIPQAFIDELVARADIVEVIGSRVPLKKRGHEFSANCPFHNEKTPSFWVSPAKQFYHCFGCGAHGTVLGFLMNYDRLPFVEAVEELASRLGLEVPREQTPGAPAQRAVDEDLYTLMGKVAAFYGESSPTTNARVPMPRAAAWTLPSSSASASVTRPMRGAKCSSVSAPAMLRARSCRRPGW